MKSFAGRLAMTAGLMAMLTATTWTQAPNKPAEKSFSGAALFDNYCATCHGARATGDGPLAALLRKPPANLTLLARRNGGEFSPEMVARIIDGKKPLQGHGGGDMPVWGDAFDRSSDGAEATSAKIKALVSFLQSIQQKP